VSARHVNWTLILTVALALVGWAVAGLRSYADDTSDLKSRIAVVETKADDTAKWRERVELKLDHLLELARTK
jgi:hypothetical protein